MKVHKNKVFKKKECRCKDLNTEQLNDLCMQLVRIRNGYDLVHKYFIKIQFLESVSIQKIMTSHQTNNHERREMIII